MNNPPIIFDVAVIGGGLAGLALAVQLSRNQYKVILFEKETYPFHKVCGEYISMESRPFLLELGLPLHEWRLPEIKQVNISAPDGRSVTASLPLGGFGISRFKLDAALAALARDNGTTLLENTRVNDVEYARELFSINTSAGLFRARLVCGCYGKRSNLDLRWKRSFLHLNRNRNYVGVKYHVRGNFPEQQIALHNFTGGYCGLSRIEDNKYCLCYLTLAENLKKNGSSIKEMERRVLWQNPQLRQVFAQIEHLYEVPLTISQISFAQKTQVENHVLFAGDAAGMITPLCGNGMSMALHGSKIAAGCMEKFLEGACNRKQMENDYQRQWKRKFASRLRTGRFLQGIFGNPFLCTLLIGMLKPFPGLVRKIIRKTHGDPF